MDEVDTNLAAVIVNRYNKSKGYIPFTEVTKRTMMKVYETLVKEGTTKIEDLPREEKIKLIDECYEAGATKENIKDMCKILYTIKLVG